VALVAPAGPLKDESELDRAFANVRSFGWEPVAGANVLTRAGYFAGSDALRAADLNWALQDEGIDGIWFLRGGYGAMRILPQVHFSSLRSRPRVMIGYSDITALHAAVALSCNIITYHGPTARSKISPFSRASLTTAVAGTGDPCGIAGGARVLRPGIASGRLLGGNLAILASLAGTHFAQAFDGAILFLEDVNEAVYRVDRMLSQLLMTGALRGCRAIVFGHCTSCDEESEGSDGGGRKLDDVLIELSAGIGVPCAAGIPSGHVDDQWTIPHGAMATLHAPHDGGGVALTIGQHA
jgi:muramoyltetrapeptide carboxypeptidase